MRKLRNNRICVFMTAMAFLMSFSGCDLREEKPLVRIPEDVYSEESYPMSYVIKGDLTYDIDEEMQLDNYKEIRYGMSEKKLSSTMLDDVTFDKLYVRVGDNVKEGDILLTLTSKSLEDSIDKYNEQKEIAEIEIRHLRNRENIDPEEDHSGEINRYEEDIAVANGYLAELEAKKEALTVRATEDGKVLTISDRAISGSVAASDDFLTVASGDDTYYTQTKESTTLKEGDIVTATNIIMDYDVQVTKIDRSANGSKIYFKIINTEEDMNIVKGLRVPVAQETRKDVLYVSKDCIKEKDEHFYAFMLDENGARIAREVKIDGIIGDNVIILEGLNEGDEVICK